MSVRPLTCSITTGSPGCSSGSPSKPHWRARRSWPDEPALAEGDQVVVEQVQGLTLSVRRAEEWEVL